ncbi:MAG: hypothetical protein JSR83_06175 [Proteobacteria bacterium]|nr:hypothetical protein [Pseudomonadota bacterium]
MNEPKLLPWMARRAGIDLDEARELWQRAFSEASALTGEQSSAAFHGLTVERFTSLIGIEDAPQVGTDARPTLRPATMRPQPKQSSRLSLASGRRVPASMELSWRNAA